MYLRFGVENFSTFPYRTRQTDKEIQLTGFHHSMPAAIYAHNSHSYYLTFTLSGPIRAFSTLFAKTILPHVVLPSGRSSSHNPSFHRVQVSLWPYCVYVKVANSSFRPNPRPICLDSGSNFAFFPPPSNRSVVAHRLGYANLTWPRSLAHKSLSARAPSFDCISGACGCGRPFNFQQHFREGAITKKSSSIGLS